MEDTKLLNVASTKKESKKKKPSHCMEMDRPDQNVCHFEPCISPLKKSLHCLYVIFYVLCVPPWKYSTHPIYPSIPFMLEVTAEADAEKWLTSAPHTPPPSSSSLIPATCSRHPTCRLQLLVWSARSFLQMQLILN